MIGMNDYKITISVSNDHLPIISFTNFESYGRDTNKK